MKFKWLSIALVLIVTFPACDNVEKRSHSGGRRQVSQAPDNNFKPSSSGKEFDIIIVNDQVKKDKQLQAAIDSIFYKSYPALPQSEAWFSTTYVNADNFGKLHRRSKSVLFVSVIPDDTKTNALVSDDLFSQKELQKMANTRKVTIKHKWDVFARPQLAMLVTAPTKEELINNIQQYQKPVIQMFDQQEERFLEEKVYSGGKDKMLISRMKSRLGYNIKLPNSYGKEKVFFDPKAKPKLKKASINELAWYSLGTDETVQNIITYTKPYADSFLTKAGMKVTRNLVTKAFVKGTKENSYMLIEDRFTNVPIIQKTVKINDRKVHALRGLWRMKNDFMGGPFLLYAIPDKSNDRIIFIDGFLYAAGEKKKPLMKRIEIIMNSFSMD